MKYQIGQEVHIDGKITITGATTTKHGTFNYQTDAGFSFPEHVIEKLSVKPTVPAPVEDKPHEYKKGDRVKALRSTFPKAIGKIGTILGLASDGTYGVQFDEYIDGHGCISSPEFNGRSGYCGWFFPNAIEPYTAPSEPSFDWDAFKAGKIAVHCDTEEKAKAFFKEVKSKLPEICSAWKDGETNWHSYGNQTTYGCYYGLSFGKISDWEECKIIDYPFAPEPSQPKLIVTAEMLGKLNACAGGRNAFETNFPNGGEFEAVVARARDILRTGDAEWLVSHKSAIEAMQSEQKKETVKLYCFNGYEDWLSKGTLYSLDSNGHIPYDNGHVGAARSTDWKEKILGYGNLTKYLVEAIQRPAKVGEYVLVIKAVKPSDGYKVGDVFQVSEMHKDKYSDCISKPYWLAPEEYLVLDGYTPEPKEEYYNGKVVCVDNREYSEYWTVGKVYEFVNGSCKADNGNVSPLFGDKIKDFSQIEKEYRVKFIEYRGLR